MDEFEVIGGRQLYQWDTDRSIEVRLCDGEIVNEVHYAHAEDDVAPVVKVQDYDGRMFADIPNILLQRFGTLKVWAVVHTEDGRQTLRNAYLSVRARAKPDDYVYTETEIMDYRKVAEDLAELVQRVEEIEENGVQGGGAVASVNGKTGEVYLNAADVGALPTTGGKLTGNLTVPRLISTAADADGNIYEVQLYPTANGGLYMPLRHNGAVANAMSMSQSATTFGKPVAISSGGHGGKNAAEGRENLEVYSKNEVDAKVEKLEDDVERLTEEIADLSWNDLQDKPFGEEVTETELVAETTLDIDRAWGYDYIQGIYEDTVPLGEEVIVTFDGVDYRCVVDYIYPGSSVVGIGNQAEMYEDDEKIGNGEPFAIDLYSSSDADVYCKEPGTHTISIRRVEESITQLDPKYLPSEVPVIQSAQVGQAVVVKTIDANGKPIEWETIEYTASNIGADASGTAATAVSNHNVATDAHNDIRDLITGLTTRLNTLADSDDTTLDQLSEIVAYIKSNKTLIENVTTNKVNVSDIVDNLTTNVANKPLSAAQGVALKALIDAITVPSKLSDLTEDSTHRTVTDAEKTTWNAKSNFSGNYNDLTNKPTNVSAFTNDAGYLTEHQDLSNYATKAYLEQYVNESILGGEW